ncbi:Hypothetical predicted protein [Xyrichtys novacula]|uniref:Secreted protein n=1 Tax=Xyrichtys novacula TaxID=13765 RepID=A0AAV1GPZ4_XYRNO|nr:Hypothetical predicted protein [Xyrichtys novacula]
MLTPVYVFVNACVCARVCVRVCVGIPNSPTPPLLCLKSFSRVTSLGHRALSNQSHAASLGADLLSSRGRSLPQHFKSCPVPSLGAWYLAYLLFFISLSC